MAQRLIIVADKYGLTDLKSICERILFVNLSSRHVDEVGNVDAVVDALLIGERLGCNDLLLRAWVVLKENAGKLSGENRVKLIQTDPELVLKMLAWGLKTTE